MNINCIAYHIAQSTGDKPLIPCAYCGTVVRVYGCMGLNVWACEPCHDEKIEKRRADWDVSERKK